MCVLRIIFSKNLQYQTIILKCEFVKFEGLLIIYISKLIPMIGKLIGTHFIVRFVCQKPPGPLKRVLESHKGT